MKCTHELLNCTVWTAFTHYFLILRYPNPFLRAWFHAGALLHFRHVISTPRSKIQVMPTKEINPSCRQLIVDNFEWCKSASQWRPKPCIHGDILESLPPNSFSPSDSFFDRLLAINRAPLKKRQFCYTHNGLCPILEGLQSDMDTSGLPCPDMSKAGKGLREEGLTSSVFIAHAKLHCAKKTPLLVIENVEDIMIITSDHVRWFKNNPY